MGFDMKKIIFLIYAISFSSFNPIICNPNIGNYERTYETNSENTEPEFDIEYGEILFTILLGISINYIYDFDNITLELIDTSLMRNAVI